MFLLWNLLTGLFWPLLYFYAPFRSTLRQRLGRAGLEGCDADAPGLCVLINAVSAGEVNAITPLIKELHRQRPDVRVALLTTTRSGRQLAEQKLAGETALIAYFPLLDLPWVVRRYLDRLRPDIYVTTENELWPNILGQCGQRGIPRVLVNGRLYLHNKRGLRGRLAHQLLEMFELIVCQDDQQYANYIVFGVPERRLAVSGNLKFDYTAPQWSEQQEQQWRQRFAAGGSPIVVAGSTHPGEEALILATLDTLSPLLREQGLAQPRLVLAPRHVSRAPEVVELARRMGREPQLFSSHEPGSAWDVLVVDAYGVLVDLYRLADVVIMGGTFHEKVGGHNILEATALGRPVIVGEHVFSIAGQVELLLRAQAIVPSRGNLQQALALLLLAPEEAALLGARALQVTRSSRGAAQRAARLVLELAPRNAGAAAGKEKARSSIAEPRA